MDETQTKIHGGGSYSGGIRIEYPINEIFYSLKGEGRWTGHSMIFVRFSGCNLQCPFCDTKDVVRVMLTPEQILKDIDIFPSNRVVLTGGEPLIHNLEPLLTVLRASGSGYQIHLETNGTINTNLIFDWIACSPKGEYKTSMLRKADEIKVLIGANNWVDVVRDVEDHAQEECLKLVMPIAKSWHNGDRSYRDMIEGNIVAAIDFVKRNPDWAYCAQLHKYLNIP